MTTALTTMAGETVSNWGGFAWSHARATFTEERRMHHGSRRLMILLLAFVGLMSPATLASAVDQTPTLAGTVSMVVNSVALGPGVEWGQGILSLSDGTQYRFTVKGLEAGGVGAAQAFLHGHVYHVTKVADFAGLYGAVDIGFTVLGGQGGMAMRNQHGVLIYLESVESGVQLTLSVAGIEILLQP